MSDEVLKHPTDIRWDMCPHLATCKMAKLEHIGMAEDIKEIKECIEKDRDKREHQDVLLERSITTNKWVIIIGSFMVFAMMTLSSYVIMTANVNSEKITSLERAHSVDSKKISSDIAAIKALLTGKVE